MALQLPPTTDRTGVTHEAPVFRCQTFTVTRGRPGSGLVKVEIVPAIYASAQALADGLDTIKPDGKFARRRLQLSKTPAVDGEYKCPKCETAGTGMELPATCPAADCDQALDQTAWTRPPREAVNEIPNMLAALAGNGTPILQAIDADLKAKYAQELANTTSIPND